MYTKIAVLGSTGTIGTQTLEVAQTLGIEVVALAANTNMKMLAAQIIAFKPQQVAVANDASAHVLRELLGNEAMAIEILQGSEALMRIAQCDAAELVVNAVSGCAGIIATLSAIRQKKAVALANRESLVIAGKIVMEEARRHQAKIIPLAGTHSAIFQSMLGYSRKHVSKFVLTCTGGPLGGRSRDSFVDLNAEDLIENSQSLRDKIRAIDSATLMKSGLEVLEARWLFMATADMLAVWLHPQGIVQALVAYEDGAMMAQMAAMDKRLPIQFAMTYPARMAGAEPRLDVTALSALTFQEADRDEFPCLKLAFEAQKAGGTYPCVLNAANEEAVKLFLNQQISFLEIPEVIEEKMLQHSYITNPVFEEILEVDWQTRNSVSLQFSR